MSTELDGLEAAYGVRLVRKDRSWTMRILGLFLGRAFREEFWTTYRLPFRRPVIAYPPSVKHPRAHEGTIAHEGIHVVQFSAWYAPLTMVLAAGLLPLPILFSGRWWIERPAYLADIRSGRRTVDSAVATLWNGYGWPWPRSLMRRWFLKQLERG